MVLADLTDDGTHILVATEFRHKELIKSVPGAKWDRDLGQWLVPLSWASCVALRTTFRQELKIGDALTEWARDYVETVYQPAVALRDALTADGDPDLFEHQRADVQFLATTQRAILASEMGTGKTGSTIRAMVELHRRGENVFPALVVCPNSVKENWAREITKFWPGTTAQVVRGTAVQRRKQLAEPAHFYIINYESLKSHSRLAPYGSTALRRCVECGGEDPKTTVTKCDVHERELNKMHFQTVIADECFVPDALVATPQGGVKIADLRVGDVVWGYDETQGRVVETTVTDVLLSDAPVMANYVTPSHPVRVDDGYRPVGDLTLEDRVITLGPDDDRNGMPAMRSQVLGSLGKSERWSKVLLSVLRTKSAVRAGPPSTRDIATEHANTPRTRGRSTKATRSPVRTDEPVSRSGSSSQGNTHARSSRVANTQRRKWARTVQTSSVAPQRSGPWMVAGGGGTDTGMSTQRRASLLQSRYRALDINGRHRSRWGQPSHQVSAGARPEKGLGAPIARMDGSEVLEPRSPSQLGRVRVSGPTRIVNLTTGTKNFFADGVLVHNSHRIKDPTTRQTRALKWVAKKATFRYALTGTPVANNVVDLWSILNFIDPVEWPSKTRWIDRLVDVVYNVFGGIVISGVKPDRQDEFNKTVYPRMRRMTKEVVLPFLPPIVTERRDVALTPKQKKAYTQMAEHMMAMLDDEDLLVTTNPMVQAMRLLHLASSYGEIETAEVTTEDGSIEMRDRLILSDPSSKIEAFMDDLADYEGRSVIVFAVSRQLIMLLSKHLEKKGVDHGLIVGAQHALDRQESIDDFQSGRTKMILATVQAGGTGINLTAADTVVYLQRSWSLIDMDQSMARAHRIGSEVHESILRVDYVAPDTFEEVVIARLEGKSAGLEEIVRDKELLKKAIRGEAAVPERGVYGEV